MPKKKKSPRDMTTEEIAKEVFPKKAMERLKEMAHEKEKEESEESSHS